MKFRGMEKRHRGKTIWVPTWGIAEFIEDEIALSDRESLGELRDDLRGLADKVDSAIQALT